MFFGLYDPTTGTIRKCLEGPSAEWAALNANEGELVIESDTPIDNSRQAVDVASDPHTLVDQAYIPTPDELKIIIVRAVQGRLDTFAQSRGYDGILSACTYATDALPQFAAEGQRAIDLRSQTWAKLYAILGEVETGTRPIPDGYEDIEEELPTLSW
jgi:hypothetical protein